MNKQVIIVLTMAILLTSCQLFSTKNEAQKRPAIAVKIAVTDSTTSKIVRRYVGKIEENSMVALTFPQGGKLTKIYKKAGDRVRKNDLIAEVDKENAKNSHKMALAGKKQADDAYNRLKKLHEKGGVSEVKWVEMTTNRDKANALAELSHKRLIDCELRSPADGTIGKIEGEIGSHLLPNQRFASLIDVRHMQVAFSVPETEIGQIEIGQNVTIEIVAFDNETRMGTIATKSLIANVLTHSYEVKILLDNSDQRLLPGMTCKIKLEHERAGTFVVPSCAVQTRPEGASVWLISNGKARRQAVSVGEYVENGVQIVSGISHGDSVIVEGQNKLFVGADVVF